MSLSLVEQFINRFKRQQRNNPQDEFAPKAIEVLEELKKELNKAPTDLQNIVYPYLKFHFWYDKVGQPFGTFVITEDDLASYVIMERFIDTLEQEFENIHLNKPIAQLLVRFNQEALYHALEQFKNSVLVLPSKNKHVLRGICDGLTACIGEDILEKAKGIKTDALYKTADIAMDVLFKGFSIASIQKIINSAGAVYKEYQENHYLIPIISFMLKFNVMVEQEQINTWEIVHLQKEIPEVKRCLMQLPNIKEVDRFHWMINLICNFINQYICEVFDSQKVKDINRFFRQYETVVYSAKEQEIELEAQFNSYCV